MWCEPLRGDTFIVLRRDDAMQCDTVSPITCENHFGVEPKRYESGHVGYEISTIENGGVVPPSMKLQWLKNKMEEFNSPPTYLYHLVDGVRGVSILSVAILAQV